MEIKNNQPNEKSMRMKKYFFKNRQLQKLEILGIVSCIKKMDYPDYVELEKLLNLIGLNLVVIDKETSDI